MESDNLKVLEKIMNIELKTLYDRLCINRLSLKHYKNKFCNFPFHKQTKNPCHYSH